MSNKKLVILAIIAGLMIILAVVQSRDSSRPRPQAAGPVYLIQGFNPAEIGGITLQAKENTMTLRRVGNSFVVSDRDDYPALGRKVNELITGCLDIKTVELYTDDKTSHKDLGVTEADARTVIKFIKPDSSVLTGVIIGKSKEQGEGTYVRLVLSDKVYVTLDRPWFTDRPMGYINSVITQVTSSDVESVTVSDPNGTYTLKTEAGGRSIVIEDIAVGKKLKDKESKNVIAALENLRFDDVKRESTFKGLFFERQYVCRLKDSTVYTLNVARKYDKTYITCDAEFTDKRQIIKADTVESEEQLKEKEAKLLARDKAERFSMKHKEWVYEISQYRAKHLTMGLSELLEDKQPQQQAEEAGDPNAA